MGIKSLAFAVTALAVFSVASLRAVSVEAQAVNRSRADASGQGDAALSVRVGSPVAGVLAYLKAQGVDPKESRGAYATPKGMDHVTIPLNPQTSDAVIWFGADAEKVESISVEFHPEGSPQKAFRSYNAASRLRLFEDGSYEVRFLPPSDDK